MKLYFDLILIIAYRKIKLYFDWNLHGMKLHFHFNFNNRLMRNKTVF